MVLDSGMSAEADVGQLLQQIDKLVKAWGLDTDSAAVSLPNSDILMRCKIGDAAKISKLKARHMQVFTDSASAMGLRVIGMLIALLEQQVCYSSFYVCFSGTA
jgi:hypothetical protein